MVTYPYWMSLIPFVTLLLLILGCNAGYAFLRSRPHSKAPSGYAAATRNADAAGGPAAKKVAERKRFKPAA